MVDITKALAIQGWMAPDELVWLAMQASTRSKVVELGCWKGRSTRAIAQHTPGVVFAVDTWRGSPGEGEHSEAHQQSPEELAQFSLNKVYSQFRRNMKDLPAGKVVSIMGDGTVAAEELFKRYGNTFDMVFIDAEHTTQAVTRDIANYQKLLRPGGLLSGHDYNWDSVKKAVDASLGGVGTFLSIWYKQV
jgi:predicted O-methyltransferase YrrM